MGIDWVAVGAFLSGVGSVLTAVLGYRYMRRVMHNECEERLNALREGIRIGKGER